MTDHPNGTVTFEAGGTSRSLRCTTNALCLIEGETGKTALEIATELDFNPSMATVRTIFWAAGGDHGLTKAQVGDMIDSVGIGEAVQLAKSAFAAAFPDADGTAKKVADGPPPPAAAG